MTDKKISGLDPAAALTGAEQVEVVQSGDNFRTTTADIAALSSGTLVPTVTIDDGTVTFAQAKEAVILKRDYSTSAGDGTFPALFSIQIENTGGFVGPLAIESPLIEVKFNDHVNPIKTLVKVSTGGTLSFPDGGITLPGTTNVGDPTIPQSGQLNVGAGGGVATGGITVGNVTAGTAAFTAQIIIANSAYLLSAGDDTLILNGGVNGPLFLVLGNSNFTNDATSPALKADGSTKLQLKLGDDSDFAPFEADTIRTKGYIVSALPVAGTAGRRAHVTDALAPAFLVPVAGLGTVVCPVFDDGTNWVAG